MTYPLPKSTPQMHNGLPVFPFASPILAHVGRYVDSSDNGNMRPPPMHTARARAIRDYPAQDRLAIRIGNALTLFKRSTTFAGRLTRLVPVGSNRGLASPWDGMLYPDNPSSGWVLDSPDEQDPMGDGMPMDIDDRGLVYGGFPIYGWGIARDDGRTNRAVYEKVVQMGREAEAVRPDSIAAIRVGARYFAIVASAVRDHACFDVTDPSNPQLVVRRTGAQHAMRMYDRSDMVQRLAYIDGANALRIVTYGELVAGQSGLPLSARTGFVDVAYGDSGVLWAVEEGGSLWRVAPNGVIITHAPFAGLSEVRALSAGGGYVVVSGTTATPSGARRDVRLARIGTDSLNEVDLGGFFRNFYHGGLAGYAAPRSQYVKPQDVQLVMQDGRTYLMYSAGGLGDVFELAPSGAVQSDPPVVVDPPRVDPPVVTPPSGPADVNALKAECERTAREIIDFASRGSMAALTPFAQAIDKLVAAVRR